MLMALLVSSSYWQVTCLLSPSHPCREPGSQVMSRQTSCPLLHDHPARPDLYSIIHYDLYSMAASTIPCAGKGYKPAPPGSQALQPPSSPKVPKTLYILANLAAYMRPCWVLTYA
jgi:hypothetical protein